MPQSAENDELSVPSHLTLDIYDTEPPDSRRNGGDPHYLQKLRTEQAACCEALDASGCSPYKHYSGGQQKWIGIVDAMTGEVNSFRETKPFQSLPLTAVRKRREALGPLVLACSTLPLKTLRTAVITFGQRCHVKDLRGRLTKLFEQLERFFTSCRRSYPVELLFASAETSVRDCTGRLHADTIGLLYHAHLHCIFRVKGRMTGRWKKWCAAFKKAFKTFKVEADHRGAYVHDCGTLKSVVAACTYITKVPQYREILNAGEFPQWHTEIHNFRMQRAYGALRAFKAKLKREGKRVIAKKEIDGAGPLWRWKYSVVEVQHHPGPTKAEPRVPSQPRTNHLKAVFTKQDRQGYWRRYAVFENPAPDLTGHELLLLAGLVQPISTQPLCSL